MIKDEEWVSLALEGIIDIIYNDNEIIYFICGSDLLFTMYTSGSTGNPK